MIRRSLTLTIILATALLGFTASAGAVSYTGSGGGPTAVPGGSGGGGGTFYYYNLRNVQFQGGKDGFQAAARNPSRYTRRIGERRLKWLPLFDDIRKKFQNGTGNRGVWRKATNRYIRHPDVCGPQLNTAARVGCPLWFNKREKAPSYAGASNRIQAQVHNTTADGGAGITGQIVAYNVKIWRENPMAEKMTLIMERQLGVGLNKTENGGGDINRSSKYWWYGGNPEVNGKKTAAGKIWGGSFSLPGESTKMVGAGPIGNGQTTSASNCRANTGSGTSNSKDRGSWSAKNSSWRTCYWESRQMGPNPFDYDTAGVKDLWKKYFPGGKPPRRADDVFGPDTRKCKNGILCRGFKESFRLNWILPTGSNSNKPRTAFSFVLNGAPGLFYAVQIVGVDNREQIVPIRRPRDFTFATKNSDAPNRQYFQVFMASPPPPDPNKPEPFEYSSNEPEVTAALSALSPLQTNQPNRISVSMNPDVTDDPDSFVFPRKANLYHFTPQLNYSDPWAALSSSQGWSDDISKINPANLRNVYSSDYVFYNDIRDQVSNHLKPSEFDYFNPTNTGVKDGDGQPLPVNTQLVDLSKAGRYQSGEGGNVASDFNWEITWLHPTLENPCPQSLMRFPFDKHARWPAANQLRECPDTGQVFNAWDDLLYAKADWEAQSVIKLIDEFTSPEATGLIKDQLLRCNASYNTPDPVPARTETEGLLLTSPSQTVNGKRPGRGDGTSPDPYGKDNEKYRTCPNAVFGLESNVLNVNDQSAQGKLNIEGTNNRAKGSAFITLQTNRPHAIQDVSLDNKDPNGNSYSISSNTRLTRNGNVNLNYCRQGVPSRANGRQVKLLKNGSVRRASASGDPNCRGYVVRYVYNKGKLPARLCSARKPANAAISNRWIGSHVAPRAGRYFSADKGYGRARAYRDNDFNGAPFVGKVPGSGDNFYADCHSEVDGRPTKGNWHRTWAFQKIRPARFNANRTKYCRFTKGQINALAVNKKPNSNAPAGRGTRCGSTSKYAFGFWYPSNANWVWDETVPSCKPAGQVNQASTELGAGKSKRTAGKYKSPGVSGKLGVSDFQTFSGGKVKRVSRYFSANVWSCGAKRKGFSRSGEWQVIQGAQKGWGRYNAGDRVPNGEYIVNFNFRWGSVEQADAATKATAGPYNTTENGPGIGNTCPMPWRSLVRPGTCWSLQATYEGQFNKVRVSRYRTAENDNIDAQYIKVYGPKAAR